MEWFDRIVTLGTILLICWLFIRNPGEFVREWIIRPFWGAETADRMAGTGTQPNAHDAHAHDARTQSAHAHDARTAHAHDARTQSAHAHDARAQDEHARIDCAARALAAGWAGEATIIETLFDGVQRGGSARYIALRDAVREQARMHGAGPPRTITISNKREIEL